MSSASTLIDNLLIIDVPHADRIPNHDLSWKQGAFFPAEECDRQLLIGSKDEMERIPTAIRNAAVTPKQVKNDDDIIIEAGAGAYRHLLNVAVGMLDKQLGEKETIEGIRSKWHEFSESGSVASETRTDRKAKFGNVMQALFADSKAVRAKVFEDRVGGNYLRPVSAEPAVAARNMLDVKPVDKVLIIGEKDGITLNTLKTLDTAFRAQTPDEARVGGIVITHPDPEEYAKLATSVTQLKRDKKLKGAVECKPYAEAMAHEFIRANFVFNCQPMDNSAGDLQMINNIRNRTNPTAVMVHLKGIPQNRNQTSEMWKETPVEGVFFVEDLQRQNQLDRLHNSRMRELAERAIENCLISRKMGRQPVKDRLLMETNEYAAFVSKAPAGYLPPEQRSPIDHAARPKTQRQVGE